MHTNRKLRCLAGGLLAAALACGSSVALAAGTTLSGNVAPWVKNATKQGPAASSTQVTIAVHLNLRNVAALKTLVSEVSSPASKTYGRYLDATEFDARFAPAAADVDAVKALLEHAGMTHVTVGGHGAYVTAVGSVAQIGATFGVDQNLYSYRGYTLRANSKAPTIPAALAGKVLFIGGLDDSSLLRTPQFRSVMEGKHVAPAATVPSVASAAAPVVTPPPVAANLPSPYCNQQYDSSELIATLSTAADLYGAAIPWLDCGYTPQQVRSAYGADKVKYTGKGVTVAITDAYASPTLLADANRYAKNHGLPKLVPGENWNEIIPEGIYNVDPNATCQPYGWWTEQSLDVAAVHGMAPGANILYVGSEDCATSLDSAFFNVVYNHLADVVTNSWSQNGEAVPPGYQASYDQAAMAGDAQGMTILFSSGDDGDLAAINGIASGAWPSTSAWVTGVGGTSMLFEGSGAKQEYGWGNYRAYLTDATVNSATSVTDSGVAQVTNFGVTYDDFSFYAGSGGGISLLETQPSYQAKAVPTSLATTLNLASGYTEALPLAMRVAPDIAALADPYTGYLYGETMTIAGNPISDAGCKPISSTTEYCEESIGGTSLASPLMAGMVAILDQKRHATGEPVVGFANPLFYSAGSRGDGVHLTQAINQIIAPTTPVSVLRGYANDLTRLRVVTLNSVPYNITTAPYALQVCGAVICFGIDDVFNYTSLSTYAGTPAGYNDVTGLGVPWLPKLVNEE